MKISRFTISQLLAMSVVVSSLLALTQYSDSKDTVWRETALAYTCPLVPDEYADNGRARPVLEMGMALSYFTIDFADGHELYTTCHRRGWELCRRQFYQSSELQNENYQFDVELSSENWTWEHHNKAFFMGYDRCRTQIENLLVEYSNSHLRRKIGYSQRWHTIPLGALFFAGLFAVAILRPTQRNGG